MIKMAIDLGISSTGLTISFQQKMPRYPPSLYMVAVGPLSGQVRNRTIRRPTYARIAFYATDIF